jgi:TetR/AcrR family transcriptional repressor of nem operon
MPGKPATATAILDVAQRLVQSRGYNGFSFKDIAAALGIRTASIHYHFPTKTDLGVRLAARYREQFMAELGQIEARSTNVSTRLRRFADLFRRSFEIDSRLCLCGMLSAEIATLPEDVAAEVELFFRTIELWLARVLQAGRRSGEFGFSGSAAAQARLLIASLEGAMIVARGLREGDHFSTMIEDSLARLRPPQAGRMQSRQS